MVSAMRTRLPPFPSSVHPPSTRPCLSLSPSFLPPVSSLLPHPSSLPIPLSSLHLFAKETRLHLRPPAWVPRDLSLGSPSLGSLSTRGSWGLIGSLQRIALYCTALLCAACACVLFCASHASAHIALLCLELYSIALSCICSAHSCRPYFALHSPRIRFPWQCVALHCHCMNCIPFNGLHFFALNVMEASSTVSRLCSVNAVDIS